MSVRRIDARFLLPSPVRTAVVLGGLDEWRMRLGEAGVEVASGARPDGPPDLVVAPAAVAADAASLSAMSVVLEGSSVARALRSAGYHVQRFLPLPNVEKPELYIPLDQPGAARYAVDYWTVPTRRWKRWRNQVLRPALLRTVAPRVRSILTIGARVPNPPFLISAAGDLGVPPGVSSLLTLGQIQAFSDFDSFYRGVFHVFQPGDRTPTWVLKFARIPGLEEDFDRDERGLELAQAVRGSVASHAPRLLGRFQVDGLQASLETAATGLRLVSFLNSTASSTTKLRVVEEIAAWTVELGRQTRALPDALEAERTRLTREVLPRWVASGAPADLLERASAVPSVLRHGDLWSWNLVVRPGDFTVVDWEDAVPHSFPLWDLVYFLDDALAELDGQASLDQRTDHFVHLFRGDLPTSELLFRWIRTAVQALDIPADAVGPLTTLCWLDHGLPDQAKEARRVAHGFDAHPSLLEAAARAWLADPALGRDWDRWRG